MFLPLLTGLRQGGVSVALGEWLEFLAALRAGLVTHDPEGFDHLARLTLD